MLFKDDSFRHIQRIRRFSGQVGSVGKHLVLQLRADVFDGEPGNVRLREA
jgi:hypothetical protein